MVIPPSAKLPVSMSSGPGEQVRAFSYIDDVAPIIARGPLVPKASVVAKLSWRDCRGSGSLLFSGQNSLPKARSRKGGWHAGQLRCQRGRFLFPESPA